MMVPFGHFGWGMGLGMLVMIAFWLLIVVFLVWLIQFLIEKRNPVPEKSPLKILESRFANGEIGEEEFESKRRVLLKKEHDG